MAAAVRMHAHVPALTSPGAGSEICGFVCMVVCGWAWICPTNSWLARVGGLFWLPWGSGGFAARATEGRGAYLKKENRGGCGGGGAGGGFEKEVHVSNHVGGGGGVLKVGWMGDG